MAKLTVPVGMRRSLRLAFLVATFEIAAMPTHLSALDVATSPTPTETPLPCTLLFSGRVTDAISGAAIDGASLCLNSGFCTQTDHTGAYAGLCYPGASSAGTQLCAEAAGYKKACQGPWTPTGDSLEVNFALEPVATPTPTPTTPAVDHPTPTPTPTETPTFTPTSNRPRPVARATAYPNPAHSGDLVTLDGTASSQPFASAQWYDGEGMQFVPGLVATFIAPNVTSETTLTFRLDLANYGMSSGDSTSITVTVLPPVCTGDCNDDRTATVDEVVMLVNIALGEFALSACPAGDRSGDGQITIDELIVAVQSVLTGCPGPEPRFAICGDVSEFPGCSGYMRGIGVVLGPLGLRTHTAIGPDPSTAGTFSFEELPPGDYTLTIDPSCNPYGCWPPVSVHVVDQDVSVHVCNVVL